MKQRFFNPAGLLMLVIGALTIGFASCKEKEPEMPSIPPTATLKVIYDGNEMADGASLPQVVRAGDDYDIAIQGTRNWTIHKPSSATWVELSRTTGPANATTAVNIKLSKNDGELRDATLTISADDGTVSKKIVVMQDGDMPDIDAMAIADFRTTYLDQIKNSTTKDKNGNPYITLPEEVVFMGTVVSDGSAVTGKNIEDYLFALQDDDTAANSGVVINLTGHGLSLGDLVIVTCDKDNEAKLYSSLLQVNATSVRKVSAMTPPAPIAVTAETLRNYESQVIKIENVQVISDAAGQTWSGSKTFITEGGASSYTSYVKSAAKFSGNALSTGSGYLVGLSGVFGTTAQIQPRNADDLKFLTGERFDGPAPADEGKNVILQENMGAENCPTPYESVNAWNTAASPKGFQKAGPGAALVVYSTPTATGVNDASVRYSTSQISANYTKASGGNNVFFGGSSSSGIATPTFVISNIALGGTNELFLGFGYNDAASKMTVSYKEDDGNWQPLTLGEKTSTSWGYFATPFTVTTGTELLSLKFEANVASTLRIDDIYVTTNQTYTQVYIPTATTGDASVNKKDVTLNGTMTYEGTAGDITEYGFAYGVDEDDMKTKTATAGATFSATVTALEPGIYSWYAYVKKGTKTYKGATKTFTVEPDVITTMKISDIISGWAEGEIIDVGNQIIGTIVSDKDGMNAPGYANSFAIVDGTAQNSGIYVFEVLDGEGKSTAHTFAAGTKVVVNVGGAKMVTTTGQKRLTGIELADVSTANVPGETPTYDQPVVINSSDMGNYQSMLVKIDSKPAPALYDQTWSGTKTFTDGQAGTLTVYTYNTATFKDTKIPYASGSLTGIAGCYNTANQLWIRNASDISLTTTLPYVSVSPAAVSLAAGGEAKPITVTSSIPNGYTLKLEKGATDTWYTAEFNGDKTQITVTAGNNGGGERNGSIKVYVIDSSSLEVTAVTLNVPVKQLAAGTVVTTYSLVTSTDQITAGQYIFVGRQATTPVSYWIMDSQSGSFILAVNAAEYFEGDVFTDDNDYLSSREITLAAVDGNFTAVLGGKYIYASGGTKSNALALRASNSDKDSEWSITIDATGNTANVIAQGESTRNYMRFNYNSGTNPRFCGYASNTSTAKFFIYKKN